MSLSNKIKTAVASLALCFAGCVSVPEIPLEQRVVRSSGVLKVGVG